MFKSAKYSRYAAIAPQLFCLISWNEETIKVKWWAWRTLKPNRVENLTKHASSVHVYAKEE